MMCEKKTISSNRTATASSQALASQSPHRRVRRRGPSQPSWANAPGRGCGDRQWGHWLPGLGGGTDEWTPWMITMRLASMWIQPTGLTKRRGGQPKRGPSRGTVVGGASGRTVVAAEARVPGEEWGKSGEHIGLLPVLLSFLVFLLLLVLQCFTAFRPISHFHTL